MTEREARHETPKVIEEFTHAVKVDGSPITFGVKIVEIRPAGEYEYRAMPPFESSDNGKLMEFGQWCEYVLIWPYDNDPDEGLTWESIQCDNGIESQRHNAKTAREWAINTLNEFAETGIDGLTELFGEME